MIKWDSKELLDNTRHELFLQFGYTITNTEIIETVRAFFSMVRLVMRVTTVWNRKKLISGIVIPNFGVLRVNNSAKKSLEIKRIWGSRFKEGSHEEQLAVIEGLFAYGWKYFKWDINKGYLFVHEDTGTLMAIRSEEAKTALEAKKKALFDIEEFCYHEGLLPRKELNLVPFIWKPIKCIYKYDLFGIFIRRYETIHEVCLDERIAGWEVRKKLIRNEDTEIYYPGLINGFVYFIGDGYVGPRVFRNPRPEIKYTQIVSILDRNTLEVIYDRIGTIHEAAKFLQWTKASGVIEPYYIYKKGILENKTIYGYKWRREDTPENDNLQAERNRRESTEMESVQED